MNQAIKNTQELREMLLQTIQEVKAGKVEVSVANSVANLSGKVLQTARYERDIAKDRARVNGVKPEPLSLPLSTPKRKL